MELHELNNVEIFASGKWNNDVYSNTDLDSMVESFKEVGKIVKPYLKLGHSNNQSLLQKDGLPAAGWITNVRRQDNKLIADIKNIPKKIYNLIKNKAYGRFSSEIYWNPTINGKQHKRVLKGVALLGADIPAVENLDDFINLYTNENNYNGEIKQYHNIEDKPMEEKKVEIDVQGLEEHNEIVKKYEKDLSDKDFKISELESTIESIQDQIRQVEYDKRYVEVKSYIDKALDDGKIFPAQVEMYTALAMDESLKKYSKDDKEIESSGFDLVKGIIESNEKLNLDESSQMTDEKQTVYSKDDEQNEGDILDAKIREYMKEHNVDYKDAFSHIAREVK